MSLSGKNDRAFDLRVVNRYIAAGRLAKEEYEAHLASLPDVSDNVRPREEGGDDDGYERPIASAERIRKPLPIVSVRDKYEGDDDDDDDYDDDYDDEEAAEPAEGEGAAQFAGTPTEPSMTAPAAQPPYSSAPSQPITGTPASTYGAAPEIAPPPVVAPSIVAPPVVAPPQPAAPPVEAPTITMAPIEPIAGPQDHAPAGDAVEAPAMATEQSAASVQVEEPADDDTTAG